VEADVIAALDQDTPTRTAQAKERDAVQRRVLTLRRLRPAVVSVTLLVAALPFGGCRASYHPLEAAAACHCSPLEYCRVRATSGAGAAVECVAFPAACAASPSCGCIGRPIDACREELGAFTVLEPRSAPRCDDCAREEYCWVPDESAPGRMCGLIPARCEDTPTCDCLLGARHGLGAVTCNERQGRIEAGPRREMQ
jgi:hypothetical protein